MIQKWSTNGQTVYTRLHVHEIFNKKLFNLGPEAGTWLTVGPLETITIAFCSISLGEAENHGFGAPFGETFFPEVSSPLCGAEK